ncbi:helix-hairpin-helix domain-containing protein [Bacillus canaveralius]|nr:helix-hairpin-helix domain-containing protein [Bacillus canaveralius]
MKEIFKKYKYVMIALAVFSAAAIFYYQEPAKEEEGTVTDLEDWGTGEKPVPEKTEAEPKTIMADIKGQVVHPGVYETAAGERVIDLIEKAGGLTPDADQAAVNFALQVTDEMMVYIPAIGEETGVTGGASPTAGPTGNDTELVNINTADPAALETLPGIGPSKSAAIIEYRDTNGAFKTVDDLKSISGIGEKTFEKLKDKIIVK